MECIICGKETTSIIEQREAECNQRDRIIADLMRKLEKAREEGAQEMEKKWKNAQYHGAIQIITEKNTTLAFENIDEQPYIILDKKKLKEQGVIL